MGPRLRSPGAAESGGGVVLVLSSQVEKELKKQARVGDIGEYGMIYYNINMCTSPA